MKTIFTLAFLFVALWGQAATLTTNVIYKNYFTTNANPQLPTLTQIIVTNQTIYQTQLVNQIITTNLQVTQTNIVNNEITTNLTIVNDFRVSRFATFNTFIVTNGIDFAQSNMDSTITTNQLDFSTGPSDFSWTNMVTNVVCQFTNIWTGGVTNRKYNFFFEGATNNGPNYTVTFLVPNPDGVVFRWGAINPTNGASSFTVTNNHGASASLTLWNTNRIEAFYSPTL